MRHSYVSGQSRFHAAIARSTGYEPNLIQNERGTFGLSISDGDDEENENSQLEQAPYSPGLENHVLQIAR